MQNGYNRAQRACPRNSVSYMWRPGDTILTVAAAHAITPGDLQALSPDVDFDALRPGDLICVPIGPQTGISTGDNADPLPGGPVLDGTANDNNTVTPSLPGGPVLDGTANDNNTVTPQRPVVVVRPGLSCPIGYDPYTIKPGQTYADLLVDLNVSYRALRTSNPGLDPSRLVAGTRFCAPPAGTRQLCARPANSYRVQTGETLATLARRFGTTQGRLLMLNPTLLPTDFTAGTIICTP